MTVNKVDLASGETLIDLTMDSVTPETLAEGATAHNAAGEVISGTMPTTSVLYTEQTLTESQKAQARENIGVKGIIDVAELPTENIREDVFYRLLSGSFVFNQYVQNMYTIHCVETLPEAGLPATNIDQTEGNVYYTVSDGEIWGYVDETLSYGLGVPVGWYPGATLLGALGYGYSGVITNILDDPMDSTFRLLLEYVTYDYKNGNWTSHKTIGRAGTGVSAEVFNHSSNTASGDTSHAEGEYTTASGDTSHAEGYSTTASGYASHTEGYDTTASGYASHTEGVNTTASGSDSHAEGHETTASGYVSHAEGWYTTASGEYQHVQGKHNVDDTDSKYAHIVGNGDYDTLSNAHTLDWDGLGWYAGGLKVGGTGQDDPEAKAVATVDYVDDALKNADTGITIPDYWQEHIDSKIAAIKALQDSGGKDCFSYVVMTDLHYPSNQGKNSPKLARYIMDRVGAKFALVLGDMRTRGLRSTKAECETEWADVMEMLSPISNRMLLTQGNHDAGYGRGDYDGDGDQDTYAYEFTPAEMFERVYRKAQAAGDVHYDRSGTAYYIDDVSNKVRYILLNTHLNFDGNAGYDSYETVNGMAKYPSMWIYRYTQCQYDFLTEDALATVPGDDWSVIMGSHVPINQSGEMPEFPVMIGVLTAFVNKTTYTGEYAGTAGGGSGVTENFTNLADPTSDEFLDGRYLNASDKKIGSNSAYAVTNLIPAVCPSKKADIIRFKGYDPGTGVTVAFYKADKTLINAANGSTYNDVTFDENGVGTWKAGYINNYISTADSNALAYVRISGKKLTTAEDIIVTVNEEITYTEGGSTGGGYDAVSVDCDFTNAKGNLISYHAGHVHRDTVDTNCWQGGALPFPIIMTRCDAAEENDATLKAERVAGTTTEQSFDVFTVNTREKKIYATKIGAGSDRVIDY